MINHSTIDTVCNYIAARPDMVIQVLTHLHEADDDTFWIVCTLFNNGYDPKDLANILNELHQLIGVEQVLSMARNLSELDAHQILQVNAIYPTLAQATARMLVMLCNLGRDLDTLHYLREVVQSD